MAFIKAPFPCFFMRFGALFFRSASEEKNYMPVMRRCKPLDVSLLPPMGAMVVLNGDVLNCDTLICSNHNYFVHFYGVKKSL